MSAKIVRSSGNVYTDLGLKNPEEHALKADLVRQIAAVMKEQELTQTAAARRLGIAQPDVSKLLRGHFRQFSVERLMRFLVALGQDVEIVVRPAMRHPRGMPRLQAMFEGYLEWLGGTVTQGRCLFMALGQEYRDRPGTIRDLVVQSLKDWHSTVARMAADAVDEGQFGTSVEPRQFAFELSGIGMAFQQSFKLLGRADAEAMARRAFGALVARAAEGATQG